MLEETFRQEIEKQPLEKGDIPAMIMAVMIITLPALLIAIGIILLVLWVFFLRF